MVDAQGNAMKNYGVKDVVMRTKEGQLVAAECQVTSVKDNLLALAPLVDRGYEVVFTKAGSFLKDPAGKRPVITQKTSDSG